MLRCFSLSVVYVLFLVTLLILQNLVVNKDPCLKAAEIGGGGGKSLKKKGKILGKGLSKTRKRGISASCPANPAEKCLIVAF